MTVTAFDKAFGTTELCLSEMILKVHDDVPNRDKRRWALLSKVTEDMIGLNTPSLALLADALEDAARERLNAMIAAVQGSEDVLTHDQARTAVLATDVGSTIAEILEIAERAAVEASPLSKRVDDSLTQKANQDDLIERAKERQVAKAREGSPISLITAIEIEKALL